jgi:hypothetical protein
MIGGRRVGVHAVDHQTDRLQRVTPAEHAEQQRERQERDDPPRPTTRNGANATEPHGPRLEDAPAGQWRASTL